MTNTHFGRLGQELQLMCNEDDGPLSLQQMLLNAMNKHMGTNLSIQRRQWIILNVNKRFVTSPGNLSFENVKITDQDDGFGLCVERPCKSDSLSLPST